MHWMAMALTDQFISITFSHTSLMILMIRCIRKYWFCSSMNSSNGAYLVSPSVFTCEKPIQCVSLKAKSDVRKRVKGQIVKAEGYESDTFDVTQSY
ncbi:hypothetical protein HHK36_024601 [Tetracentron sinense]|uniref:Uncharacterized protein n=1 Tax=Tetracentron sinense TaxID=13715 RepID=A0A834YL66_TETSI|nr:hypothetical protein HHK36_024601 [Tetracentron sinense]